MTLAEVDRALNALTPGDIGKLAEGSNSAHEALLVLEQATRAKAPARTYAAARLRDWVDHADVPVRQMRAWVLYALAGYSAPEDGQ